MKLEANMSWKAKNEFQQKWQDFFSFIELSKPVDPTKSFILIYKALNSGE